MSGQFKTMQAPSPSTIGLIALLAVLSWRAYARFKRMVGRQRLSKRRPWITLTVFSLLVLLLGYGARAEPQRLAWMIAGAAAGALLAVYGLSKTRFEPTPQGLFYTPNAHVGIVLSLLFVARIVYRLVEIYLVDPATPRDASAFVRSPLTLAVFGLLAGYFIAYAIGLMRWRSHVLETKRRHEEANPQA
jgi:FtsH-binding integral membrane protein